jgi:plastocyanin
VRKLIPALALAGALLLAGCGSDHEAADHRDDMPMGDMPMGGTTPMGGDMPMGGTTPMGSDMPMGDMPMGDMPMGDMPMGDMPMAPGHDDHEDSAVPEGARTIPVSATSYSFDPGTLTVAVGEPIAVELTSTDIEHDLVVDEVDLHVAAAQGETEVGGFTATEAGEYEMYCSVPGHREAGMVGTLVVEAG